MIEDLIKEKLGHSRDEEVSLSSTIYLDHAGAPLPTKSLLQKIFEELTQFPLANPHSTGGIMTTRTETMIQQTRQQILEFLHANSNEYEVIFTAGATASIKLIIDLIDWEREPFHLIYPQNIHTSVLSIRNFCTSWEYLPVDSLYSTNSSPPAADTASPGGGGEEKERMPLRLPPTNIPMTEEPKHQSYENIFFALPAECNMSGAKVQYEKLKVLLDDYSERRRRGTKKFYWLLDTAKYCSTSELNLQELNRKLGRSPDFVILSFYKLFGYPTGIGALIIRKEILPLMNKRYFGGGTLLAGATDTPFMIPRPKTTSSHYEDGTINFHGIAALRHGFKFLKELGGIATIQQYSFDLMKYLLQQMKLLIHKETKISLCKIYSFHDLIQLSSDLQGPTITFNLQYANGDPVGFNEVNHLCSQNNIQIRTGCFCNLGGCQYYLRINGKENEEFYHLGRVCSDSNEIDVINHRQTGACRISLGFGSSKSDCDQFLEFLKAQFLDKVKQNPLSQLLLNSAIHDSKRLAYSIESDALYWHNIVYHYPVITAHSARPVLQLIANNHQEPQVILSAIFVYPVKSCSGVRVDDWPITAKGLKYDRHFAIIDSQGKVVTQKQFPILALVQPTFHLDNINGKEMITLHITSPLMSSTLLIPLDPIQSNHETLTMIDDLHLLNQKIEFNICGRRVYGENTSQDANQWFTDYLQNYIRKKDSSLHHQSYSFVRYSETNTVTPSSCSNSNENADKTLPSNSFANSAQYLLLSTESIVSLIELIHESKKKQQIKANLEEFRSEKDGEEEEDSDKLLIKVENFRPNFIVSTMNANHDLFNSLPHQEDTWQSLSIPIFSSNTSQNPGDYKMHLLVSGPCSRCSMVNVNGSSGIMSCKVFEALADYRKVNRHIYFGQFLTFHSLEREDPNNIQFQHQHSDEIKNVEYRIHVGTILTTTLKKDL